MQFQTCNNNNAYHIDHRSLDGSEVPQKILPEKGCRGNGLVCIHHEQTDGLFVTFWFGNMSNEFVYYYLPPPLCFIACSSPFGIIATLDFFYSQLQCDVDLFVVMCVNVKGNRYRRWVKSAFAVRPQCPSLILDKFRSECSFDTCAVPWRYFIYSLCYGGDLQARDEWTWASRNTLSVMNICGL